MNRSIPAAIAAAAAAGCLSISLAAPAAADVANPNAACPGLALSDHAVSGEPGDVAEIRAVIRQFSDMSGFAGSGQVVSRWAKAHPGTHVPGCEDAIIAAVTAGP